MKKIGIITFHSAHNYGAMLQVFALQQKLKKYNYNTSVINYRNKAIDKHYKIFKIHRKNILTTLKSTISSTISLNRNFKRYKAFDSFMKNNLFLSNEFTNENELKANYPNYDIYITGSDQVWNYQIVRELSDAYTLNFGDENIKRISYAASIGDNSLVEIHSDEFIKKLEILDRISVRELDGKNALDKIINKPIDVVLDPTLLIDKNEWNTYLSDLDIEKEKYILAYVVEHNEEYIKIVNYLSKITGLKVIHFEKVNKYYDHVLKSAYTEGPFEFINLIKNAEYVIATSFHATVFSIIFNKKFFVVPHVKTGARVTNLLDKFNISNRAINTLDEFLKIDYKENINYIEVEKILSQEREKSLNWLKNAIEN